MNFNCCEADKVKVAIRENQAIKKCYLNGHKHIYKQIQIHTHTQIHTDTHTHKHTHTHTHTMTLFNPFYSFP